MSAQASPRNQLVLCLVQAFLAALTAALFFVPIATLPGAQMAMLGTLTAYVAAHLAYRQGLRVAAGVVLGILLVLLAHLLSRFIMAREFSKAATGIEVADAVYLGLGCLGAVFAIRMLRERVRALAIVEVALLVGVVAHTFADHRHQRIHQPRFLSDWAWSNGLDPQSLLAGAGIAVVVVSAILLLRGQRVAKLLLSLLLLFAAAAIAYLLLRGQHIAMPADTNGLGLTAEQDKQDSSGGGGGRRKPDPVAIALLHEDLDDGGGTLYFRQAVRSRLAGERLVADGTGLFDRDVILGYPSATPVQGASLQVPSLHRRLPTSMFLMVAHPQPVGLGHPLAYSPLDNPDPRRFVAAYGVESLVASADPMRLLGRSAVPEAWSELEREHYLAVPDDPRYAALAQSIARELDPKFVNDPVMTAFVIKRFLEVEGFYSLDQKEMVGTDPTARFLFGDLRGYCVHFAHAAVFLFRTQGIPARVALGYAVDTRRRGAGSSILILGRDAHAWPEIYIDGVGWTTFDIYPERSDEPPQPPVDEDLEGLLGELARKDPTGGRAAEPQAWFVPWGMIAGIAGLVLGSMLVFAYAIRIGRRLRAGTVLHVYRGFLDTLSNHGLQRQIGESRERHAARLAKLAPSFAPLTDAHLRWALGPSQRTGDATAPARLAADARRELRRAMSIPRRILAFLHPIGWLFTR